MTYPSEPLTPERLAEIQEDLIEPDLEYRFVRRAAVDLLAEVDRLREQLDRAHEELQQGWPKMARDANRSAIEQWNRADTAEAEVNRLRAQVAAMREWTVFGHPGWPGCGPDYRSRSEAEDFIRRYPHPDAYIRMRYRTEYEDVASGDGVQHD